MINIKKKKKTSQFVSILNSCNGDLFTGDLMKIYGIPLNDGCGSETELHIPVHYIDS